MKRRQKLIELVENKNWLIRKAGEKLGIKLSTAKLIVKRYRETGTFATRRVPIGEENSSEEPQRDR